MGLVTLAQFRDRVATALGRSGDIDTSLLTSWANEAQDEIALAINFTELEGEGTPISTVAGTESYALAADFRAFGEGGIKITSPEEYVNAKLIPESRWNWRRNSSFVASSNRGTPKYFHKYRKRLYLRPIPDAVYTIAYDYWKLPTRLSGNTDVTVFDPEWDECIFRGMLYRGHLHFGEHDRMVNTHNMFLALVRSKRVAFDLEEFPEGGINAIQSESDHQQ